jgi:hypothetical protein
VAELDAVIREAIGTDDTLAVPPPPPIATVLAGARKRVSDLEAFVEQLQARRAEVDLGDVVALHAEVVSLEAALRDGFGLPVS